MTASWLNPFLHWIAQHPHGAGFAVFFVAATEGLLLVGLLIPGVVIMFGVGAIVASGAMPLATTLLWAAAGAVCGDGLSFTLGRRYRGRLQDIWPMRRYPGVLRRGSEFFRHHGGKSVILGRFVGPVRPILPAVAGAADMAPARFFLFDSLAAALWSPSYILPGVVFGASLGLAAQVASRLAVLVLLVVAIVWGVLWLTRTAFAALHPLTEMLILRLLDWSQRHRRLGRLGPALADPGQPEAPALAVLAVGLLALSWLAFVLVWGVAPPVHPHRVDILVYQLLRGLHTSWTNTAAVALAELGQWRVYAPVAAVVLVHLTLVRRYRAALHWTAATAFAMVLAAGLHWLVAVPPPTRFYRGFSNDFSGGHMILSTVIYGFLPVLVTTGRRRTGRWPYYGTAGSLILLIALARLYLGAQWLSITAIGLAAGLSWTALLGLAYRRHNARPVPRAALAASALAVLIGAGAWRCKEALPAYWHLARADAPKHVMSTAEWHSQGFTYLPLHRVDLRSQPGLLALNLQWAGPLQAIRSALEARGWHAPPRPTALHALLWLGDGTRIDQLPVLPQFHDGRSQALVMVKPIDASTEHILRLWTSRWRLDELKGPRIWVGVVARAKVRSILSILYLPTTVRGFNTAQILLARQLAPLPLMQKRAARSHENVLLVGPIAGSEAAQTPRGQ